MCEKDFSGAANIDRLATFFVLLSLARTAVNLQ